MRHFLLATLLIFTSACTDHRIEKNAIQEKVILRPDVIAKVERFCGDCHPLPLPSSYPKANWPQEVKQGFDFYVESKRVDLEEPLRQDAVRYFQDAAPEKVNVPRASDLPITVSPIRFHRSEGQLIGKEPCAIAQLLWNETTKSLLFTDMRSGLLRKWKPQILPNDTRLFGADQLIASGRNICKVSIVDWDNDGTEDYLLSEMGSFPVADHQNGGVTLQFGGADGGKPVVIELANHLGRVVESKPIDFDDDGDFDILVAEFGWRKTGSVKLLRSIGGTARAPEFQIETIDPRHGALGVEVADIDGDGRLDFVVAFGQEYETVDVHYSSGSGHYEKKTILQLIDPSYNSSSFKLVDVDGDGKIDILHTCGDTMDTLLAKPYHGVRWIRNLGNKNWEVRELGMLVGALSATTADFDGDGDMDIAAVGLFPAAKLDPPGAYDSICWWEQRDNLNFVRHSIERDHCWHAACESGDVDGDGKMDLIVGEWLSADNAAFYVYLNRE